MATDTPVQSLTPEQLELLQRLQQAQQAGALDIPAQVSPEQLALLENAATPQSIVDSPQGPLPTTQKDDKPTKEEQKVGVVHSILASANGVLRSQLRRMGYAVPEDNQPLIEAMRDTEHQQQILKLMWAGGDKLLLPNLANGVLYLFGINPFSVSTNQKIALISNNLGAFSPLVLFLLGEQTYDQLFGRYGSQAVLAKSILNAYKPYGMDGASALNLATSLRMYFQMNPVALQGFDNEQLGKILDSAVKSGFLTPTTDGNTFIKQVANVLPVYAAVRDSIYRVTGKPPTPEEVIAATPQLLQQFSGYPFPYIAKMIRRDTFIKSIAPGGLFEAAVRASGVQSPIDPKIYVDDDIKLRQNVADSTLGNLAGATIRLVHMYGARGALGQIYNDLLTGNLKPITPSEWVAAATRSGVDPQTAISILYQKSRNKSFLTPDIINSLRMAQYQIDIAPRINAIMYTYKDPELRAGAISELASRLGYKGTGMVDPGTYMLFLHSNIINKKAKEVLDTANQYATASELINAYKIQSPLRRITDILISPSFKLDESGKPKLDYKSMFERAYGAYKTTIPGGMSNADIVNFYRQAGGLPLSFEKPRTDQVNE